MTVVETPALYEAAFRGEPLQRTVFPEPLNTHDTIWTIGYWPIRVPAVVSPAIPRLQRLIREMRERTGWSARRLGEIVGSSHTTILNAENGRPLMSGHSGDLRQRIVEAHDLIERVYVLVERDPERTAAILATAPDTGRRSAADELRETGDPGRAYLAALDVIRPRRTGLLVGDRPRREGPTTALHD
jgi:transcriptional regulator with XRE-family HTH domain